LADLALKSARIADFNYKLRGFADLETTADCGSNANFGPVSGCCRSVSSDGGSDDQFSVGFNFPLFSAF